MYDNAVNRQLAGDRSDKKVLIAQPVRSVTRPKPTGIRPHI